MPFDLSPPETKTLALADLSRLLRHPEGWPDGFEWNWQSCRTCALGLLAQHMGMDASSEDVFRLAQRNFDISFLTALKIFGGNAPYVKELQGHTRKVTPTHVADAIDAYLASR